MQRTLSLSAGASCSTLSSHLSQRLLQGQALRPAEMHQVTQVCGRNLSCLLSAGLVGSAPDSLSSWMLNPRSCCRAQPSQTTAQTWTAGRV